MSTSSADTLSSVQLGGVWSVLITSPKRSSLGENLRLESIPLLIALMAASRWSGQDAGTSIALYSSLPKLGEHSCFNLPSSFAFIPSTKPLIHGEYPGMILSSILQEVHIL